MDLRQRISDTPGGMKIGVVCAALAFVISFSESSYSNIDGVVTWFYYDYAAMGFAAIILIGVVAGFRQNHSAHPARRAPAGYLLGLAAVLVLFAALHALRGLGVILAF
ncbi:hypothetical protein ABIB25_003197 [Nakamurella sp. UYEF19]|uniref:hypothetical protein n=1 Tax=Nakamurella sp. UYEF19 TaxID=1756392 RepID=UPI0033969DE5